MTWSAPRDRTKSTFRVLHTPVTSAPSALAICTASVPTPPDAPLMRTVVPGLTWPTSRMAIMAVRPDMTDAAASLNESVAGFSMSRDAGATVNSANVPWGAVAVSHKDPNTSSPGWRSVTFLPTASTTPATSVPRTGVEGCRSPDLSRRMYGIPVTVTQSGVFTLVAPTRIRTSSSPNPGRPTVASSSTRSGGPYPCWTMAFMAFSSAVAGSARWLAARVVDPHVVCSYAHRDRLGSARNGGVGWPWSRRPKRAQPEHHRVTGVEITGGRLPAGRGAHRARLG